MFEELYKTAVLAVGGFISITVILLGFRILWSDKNDYRRNQGRSGKFWKSFSGQIKTRENGSRDFRVRAGLTVNRKNQWQEQGALSEEAIDTILLKK